MDDIGDLARLNDALIRGMGIPAEYLDEKNVEYYGKKTFKRSAAEQMDHLDEKTFKRSAVETMMAERYEKDIMGRWGDMVNMGRTVPKAKPAIVQPKNWVVVRVDYPEICKGGRGHMGGCERVECGCEV